MAKVAILRMEGEYNAFEGEQYVVDLRRDPGFFDVKGIHCFVRPFPGVDLLLRMAINLDGSLSFEKWNTCSKIGNDMLQTLEISEEEANRRNESYRTPEFKAYIPTKEQVATIKGLSSGEIKFEGLRLYVGGTLRRLCPAETEGNGATQEEVDSVFRKFRLTVEGEEEDE